MFSIRNFAALYFKGLGVAFKVLQYNFKFRAIVSSNGKGMFQPFIA